MANEDPAPLDGANRRRTVWIAAALLVLTTTGAALFSLHRKHADGKPAGTRTPATVGKSVVDRGVPASSANRATGRTVRVLPKSPVAQPFEFIRGLAREAYEGDGEAQYRIAKELDRCEMTLSLVRKSGDPQTEIWNLPAGWTQSMKERAVAELQRCSRLMREDPFADLPRRSGRYDVAYWMSRATESGQPLALVEKASNTLDAQAGGSAEANEPARVEAHEMLVTATLSGNPDALLLTGFRMFMSGDPRRKLQGAAWMLAGCQVGADCGFDSAIVPIWMCYDGGDAACQPGMDVQSMLGAGLTQADFAQAFEGHERILAGIRARDVQAIEAEIGN
jgi:hypothetical protein